VGVLKKLYGGSFKGFAAESLGGLQSSFEVKSYVTHAMNEPQL
jgi:hypothetical protein